MERIEDSEIAPAANGALPQSLDVVSVYSGGQSRQAPVFDRATLQAGQQVQGPAIIVETTATTVLEPGWRASTTRLGHLVLERVEPLPSRIAIGTRHRDSDAGADPILLEIFNNLFMSIAEQMGAALANTAYSVNIKERLDFSCAIFDRGGNLVANAPHMPVHLGSMGESIKTVLRERADSIKPGDVYALNAPYNGGTHLPDVTVISPVFDETETELLFFVASRGHHADIGGITPGSMPPNSSTVEEEGILIDNFLLVERGRLREDALMDLLGGGQFPARNPRQNLADMAAQIDRLNTSLYARSASSWSGDELLQLCRQLEEQRPQREPRGGGLQPLNPAA